LFVDRRIWNHTAGKFEQVRVDLLAGVDRKSEAWKQIERNLFDCVGDVIAEDLAAAGDDWEDEPDLERWNGDD
jgi:hypothetical protein